MAVSALEQKVQDDAKTAYEGSTTNGSGFSNQRLITPALKKLMN
jgi:hypothetical protein